MPRSFTLARRLLGLLHPEWSLRTDPIPGATQRLRGERGVRLSEERRSGEISGDVPIESATRCAYDGARIREPLLVGELRLCSFAEAEILRPAAGTGSRIDACHLDSVTIVAPQLAQLQWSGCNLREAEVQQGALGRLTLCDLAGAQLHGVRLHALVACDLAGASLRGCDLSGADLRGSSFRGADLRGTRLDEARVAGADFTGARGLSAETRDQLLRGGATLRGAWLMPLTRRLLPRLAPLSRHRLVGALSLGLWLGGGATLLGAAALTLAPPEPPASELRPPPSERSITAEDRQQTQRALASLRESLANAHAALERHGATQHVWPTLTELQSNRYDADGEGPAELWETLAHGGLPDNLLTESRGGALPYCEDNPRQEALSGVDTDWYYCELTGRIFASAGFTGEATLNW